MISSKHQHIYESVLTKMRRTRATFLFGMCNKVEQDTCNAFVWYVFYVLVIDHNTTISLKGLGDSCRKLLLIVIAGELQHG